MPDPLIEVLLIEDNPTDVLLLREALAEVSPVQFRLTDVEQLAEGLKRLGEARFDVVLLDLGLPDSQGLETFVKVHDQAVAVPIVVLTGLTDETLAVRAMQAGAQDYLVKGQAEGRMLARAIRYAIERKRAEAEIRRRNRELALLSTVIEQAAESVVITDTQGAIIYVNPGFEYLSGYSRTEVIGRNPRLLQSGQQDAAFYVDLWATISAGQVWHGRFVNKRKDGALYTAEATISPVRHENGAIVNYVGIQRDVTRELKQEEQYRQAQKMEAIGRLSGGVAHDFNNLLTAILGYTRLLLDDLPLHDPHRRDLESIHRAGERAASLTRQLLAFSRQQPTLARPLDLNFVVTDLHKLLHRLIGEDIELITRLDPALGLIQADLGQMEQVIMNLVVNARDAMPQGGKLVIETTNFEADADFARLHLGLNSGPYIRLTVSDTGHGMDAATLSRIFEPFFTTKEPGQGTGLGLATVYGIVQQSGGAVWVYSEVGQGATFKIYLPRLVEPTPTLPPPTQDTTIPGGVETILLVEDEEAVRSLSRRVLEQNGYTVLEASHGPEALLLCEQRSGPLHLLVTDMVMPGGLNGRELADRLQRLYPELKVLYMSGYADRVLEAGLHFLQKPFTPNTLAQEVRQALDSASHPVGDGL